MATTTRFTEASLVAALEKVFAEELRAEIERCADEAAEKARAAVKGRLGQLTLQMFSEYELIRQGANLLIRVRIGDASNDA